MAEVILAKTAGFCFGVKRAVDEVYKEIESGKKIYTYGPIIHNDEVVKDLEAKGVTTIRDDAMLQNLSEEDVVIIRSHGITRETMTTLEATGATLVDMTCPFVKRIHNLVSEHRDDYNIVIVGDPVHPEVVAIKSYGDATTKVISDAEAAVSYVPEKEGGVFIVSQTTFNLNKFREIVEIFEKKGYYSNVVNTICDATRKRQEEAKAVASGVDVMVVIGDLKSSNSRKLYEICKEVCAQTYFVQTLEDFERSGGDLQRTSSCMPSITVGITAGASTPNNIIEEVQKYVRNDF
ncbi:MAG: 4-hydroxy-3-methylbut-2-enyl diphosphate reductase [Lachnospiraceae bacterium]|nr:4-hydroxy-3-methylbut-2-enyl diphosphate reductase [Lachnospiraceae bacterium]